MAYLPRCLASIRAQGQHVYEHIVIDAGSTDGSREYLTTHKGPTTTLLFEEDDGPADGLNKGFARTSGDILYYLNADDELAPHGASCALGAHARSGQADILVGNGWTIDATGSPLRFVRSLPVSTNDIIFGTSLSLQQATSIRRRVWDSGLRFNPQNRTCWDFEFLVEAHRAGFTIENHDGVVGYFRIHGESITGSQRLTDEYARDYHRIVSELRPEGLTSSRAFRPAVKLLRRTAGGLRQRMGRPGFPGLAFDKAKPTR
jgi:glycosyltransferase involved in cell wall biosynthesis